jgi:hypothetical protein
MLNKNFIFFLFSGVMFMSGVIYLAMLSLSWNQAISPSDASLEVSLPVINWEKYMNLSKHLD